MGLAEERYTNKVLYIQQFNNLLHLKPPESNTMDRPTKGTQSPPQKPDILSITIPKLSRRPATSPPNEPHPLPPVSEPRSQFTIFPTLPAELRLKIWEFALPGPRVVEIKAPDCIFLEGDPIASLDFTSACAVPTPLHVNSEAREVALQHYQLSFATGTFPPRIYFCFERDTLYFPEWVFDDGSVPDIMPFVTAISSSERARIRSVAVDVDRWFGNNMDSDDEGDPIFAINGQLKVEALEGLRELCWVMLEPLPDGRCSSCADKVRPKRLGEVGLEERVDEQYDQFRNGLKKETDAYLGKLARVLGERWRPPLVRVMALTRDGVRVPPATAELAEMVEVEDGGEAGESSD